MSTIYRPEKQTDPAKMPGQIVNRPPQAVYLRDVVERIQREECCHKTVLVGQRCEGCPYAV